ncbi:MAG: hypothetical protein E6J40_00360, partial [Chloroflexi bacterium]
MPRNGAVEAHHFEALGTSCSLFGIGVSRTELVRGEFWVRKLAARITRFSDRSELTTLNRSDGEWVDVSLEMESLLREAVRAHEVSGGLVNAAVLPSMVAIGYTRPLAEGAPVVSLAVVHPAPRLVDVLAVRPGRARLERGCGLDLGGIAKGWMADTPRDPVPPVVAGRSGSVARRSCFATRARRPAVSASAGGAAFTISSIRAPACRRTAGWRRCRWWPRR